MFGRKALLGLGALAGGMILTACASSQQIGSDPVVDAKPIVSTEPSSSVGPEAGSQADLAQTAGDIVYFSYNEFALTGQAQAILSRQAAWLQQYPDKVVRISGNCDERGTREYNLALGARRANAARNFLISQGVSSSRITTISYGKERPVAIGANEAAWAQNRNSMTVLVGGGVGS